MLIDIRCVRMVLFYACYIVFMYNMYTHVTCIHIYIYIRYYIVPAPHCEHFEWIHWITWRVPSPVRPTLPRHLWGELRSRWQLMVNTYKNDLTWTWNLPLIPLGLWFPLIPLMFLGLWVLAFPSILDSIFSSYLKCVGKSLYITGWISPSGYSLSGSSSQRECQVQLCGVGSWISVRVNVSK